MKTYNAAILHGKRAQGEGRYEFEARDDLFEDTPVRIMVEFMKTIQQKLEIGHIDYEINSAFKNDAAGVVTVTGEFHFSAQSKQPFICMISAQ